MDYRKARIIRNNILKGRPVESVPTEVIQEAFRYLGEAPPAALSEPTVETVAEGYMEMSLAELKETARAWGLTGFSRLNKADLISLLQAQEQV